MSNSNRHTLVDLKLMATAVRSWLSGAYACSGHLGRFPSMELQRDIQALEQTWQSRFWCPGHARLNERAFALNMTSTLERLHQTSPLGLERLYLVGVRPVVRDVHTQTHAGASKALDSAICAMLAAWSGRRFGTHMGVSAEGYLLALTIGRSGTGVEELLQLLHSELQVDARAHRLDPMSTAASQVRHLAQCLDRDAAPERMPLPASSLTPLVKVRESPSSHRVSFQRGRMVVRDEAVERLLTPALAWARRASFRDMCNRDMTLLSCALTANCQDDSPRFVELSRWSWNNEVSRQMLLWTLERDQAACATLRIGVALSDAFADPRSFSALKKLAHRFGAKIGTVGMGVNSPGARELLCLRPDYAITATGLSYGIDTRPRAQAHLASLVACSKHANLGSLIVKVASATEAQAVASQYPDAMIQTCFC